MSWLLPSFLLSSFVDFSALFWCLLFLICLLISFSIPNLLSSVSRSFIFPFFSRRFPSSCALYFSLTYWGQLHKRQPVGSSTKRRPYRPLPNNGSNFSRHSVLGCLAFEDTNSLLSRVVLWSYKHEVPIIPKE